MAIFRLTEDNFDDVIKSNDIVVVDFWAAWCTTCSSFAPIYVEVSEAYPDVVFAKVNTQYEQSISAQYRIQSIPTLVCFKKGEEVYRRPGAIPGQFLDEIIQKLINSEES